MLAEMSSAISLVSLSFLSMIEASAAEQAVWTSLTSAPNRSVFAA